MLAAAEAVGGGGVRVGDSGRSSRKQGQLTKSEANN